MIYTAIFILLALIVLIGWFISELLSRVERLEYEVDVSKAKVKAMDTYFVDEVSEAKRKLRNLGQ